MDVEMTMLLILPQAGHSSIAKDPLYYDAVNEKISGATDREHPLDCLVSCCYFNVIFHF